MVIEVMGRYARRIALNAGIAGRADAILIPELPYSMDKLAEHIRSRNRPYSIIVVAEGAKPVGGEVSVMAREAGRQERLGGVAEQIAAQLKRPQEEKRGRSCWDICSGGGSPIAFDRILGLSFGAAAVSALAQGENGVMVALQPPRIRFVPLAMAIEKLKLVPLDGKGSDRQGFGHLSGRLILRREANRQRKARRGGKHRTQGQICCKWHRAEVKLLGTDEVMDKERSR